MRHYGLFSQYGQRGDSAVDPSHSGNACTLPATDDPRECLDDRPFPQPVFDLRPKQLNRIVRRMGALIRPAVRHGIVGIDHADDLRQQGNLVASQAVRVA